jgi:hypothetical protein
VVDGAAGEGVQGRAGSDSVSLDDGLRVDLLDRDEFLGFAQELGREDADRSGSVSDLVILDFRDIDEDLGGGVVEVDGFEDGRAVVGDGDALVRGRFYGSAGLGLGIQVQLCAIRQLGIRTHTENLVHALSVSS